MEARWRRRSRAGPVGREGIGSQATVAEERSREACHALAAASGGSVCGQRQRLRERPGLAVLSGCTSGCVPATYPLVFGTFSAEECVSGAVECTRLPVGSVGCWLVAGGWWSAVPVTTMLRNDRRAKLLLSSPFPGGNRNRSWTCRPRT